MKLKQPEARILSCRGTLHGLGYRITREGVDALPRALKRLQKRVVAELLRPENRPPEVDLERSIASTAGRCFFEHFGKILPEVGKIVTRCREIP